MVFDPTMRIGNQVPEAIKYAHRLSRRAALNRTRELRSVCGGASEIHVLEYHGAFGYGNSLHS